jgi:CHAD domain-containing protein
VKARTVKGLRPQRRLDDAAERIVGVRLDELCAFMPAAADPAQIQALHDMRIAAKRLRYVLELTAPLLGDYAATAAKRAKRLQSVLGDLHDCDVLLPRLREAGLDSLATRVRVDRDELHRRFLELWRDLEREGFRARLEFAITER